MPTANTYTLTGPDAETYARAALDAAQSAHDAVMGAYLAHQLPHVSARLARYAAIDAWRAYVDWLSTNPS